jgi:hypothetical protein
MPGFPLAFLIGYLLQMVETQFMLAQEKKNKKVKEGLTHLKSTGILSLRHGQIREMGSLEVLPHSQEPFQTPGSHISRW